MERDRLKNVLTRARRSAATCVRTAALLGAAPALAAAGPFVVDWERGRESLEEVLERIQAVSVDSPPLPVPIAAAAGEQPSGDEAASLREIIAYIREAATKRGEELRGVAARRPGALERQGAFLNYLSTLDPIPEMVYADIAASRLTYEFYDAGRDRITIDRELAAVPLDLRAAVVIHSLRHYFAVSQGELRARGREGQHDAFEAQAIFWTVIGTPREGALCRHHEALSQAFAAGALPALMDRIERGWLW